jgi:DNA-directed RNA polymerase specialized sigma24 family protein
MAHQNGDREQTSLSEIDEDRFRALVRPYTDVLIRAARSGLEFYQHQGAIREEDFTPEEVTGEALIKAWDLRERRPEAMSLRGWLLGVQHRVLVGMVEQHRAYQDDNAISLDTSAGPNEDADDVQEWFWDWYQPDSELIWEDVTPSGDPVDYEVSLDGEGREAVRALDPDTRHVLTMHDEFEMPLPEVAYTMNLAVNEVAALLSQARASLRERIGGEEGIRETDHPAPPDGADE